MRINSTQTQKYNFVFCTRDEYIAKLVKNAGVAIFILFIFKIDIGSTNMFSQFEPFESLMPRIL